MTRESVEVKGRRYLTEGRLHVHRAGPDHIVATCRGAGTLHRCGYDTGTWWCHCPARKRCAHLVALQLVAAPEPPTEGRTTGEPLGHRESAPRNLRSFDATERRTT